MSADRQYREVLGYYARGRDEGYPLDPDIIPSEGGDEYRADLDRFLARVKAEAWDDCERSLFRWFNDPFAGDEPPRNPYGTTAR